jgi:branched-subunit amino acid transport protein AzlD
MYGYPLKAVATIENISADIQEKGACIAHAAIRPLPYLVLLDGRRPTFVYYTTVAAIITAVATIITVTIRFWIFVHLIHLSRY